MGRMVHRLKSSYNVISATDKFLTKEIQAMQQRCKKCVDLKGDYVEKYALFNYIP